VHSPRTPVPFFFFFPGRVIFIVFDVFSFVFFCLLSLLLRSFCVPSRKDFWRICGVFYLCDDLGVHFSNFAGLSPPPQCAPAAPLLTRFTSLFVLRASCSLSPHLVFWLPPFPPDLRCATNTVPLPLPPSAFRFLGRGIQAANFFIFF